MSLTDADRAAARADYERDLRELERVADDLESVDDATRAEARRRAPRVIREFATQLRFLADLLVAMPVRGNDDR